MNTRHSWLGLLVALSLSGSAMAQAPAANEAQVVQLWNEAKVARSKNDWSACRDKAEQAWTLKQHRKIAAILGECEAKLGNHTRAAKRLQFFLDNRKESDAPELNDQVQQQLSASLSHIVVVRLGVAQAGAQLSLNGSPVQEGVHYLEPGVHRFAASLAGYPTSERELNGTAGSDERIDFDLALAAAPGDGGEAGAGDNDGSTAWPLWPAYVGGGVGVAAIITGAVLVGVAGGKRNDAEAEANAIVGGGGRCRPATTGFEARCGALHDSTASIDSLQNGGVAGFVIGGIALAATGGYLAFVLTRDDEQRPEADSATLQIVPMLGGQNGLLLQGTF